MLITKGLEPLHYTISFPLIYKLTGLIKYDMAKIKMFYNTFYLNYFVNGIEYPS